MTNNHDIKLVLCWDRVSVGSRYGVGWVYRVNRLVLDAMWWVFSWDWVHIRWVFGIY